MSSVLEVGQTGLTTVEESDGLLAAGPCASPHHGRSRCGATFPGPSWVMSSMPAASGGS